MFAGVSISYVSSLKDDTVTTFLHLEKLEDKTSLSIACGFKKVLKLYGIDLKNVVAVCKCYVLKKIMC